MISRKFLEEQLKKAVYRQDKNKMSVLRLLLSAVHNQEISRRRELTEDELLSVVKKEIKDRRESIEIYCKANRDDLVKKEKAELAILEKLGPQELSEEQVRQKVKKIISQYGLSTQADFGLAMSRLMAQNRGQVDGSLAAKIVKEELEL
jgi:uncharacterized protein